MDNFANSTLVSALLYTYYKREEINRHNWDQIESEMTTRIANLLEVDSQKAKRIFRDGLVALWKNATQSV